MTDKLCSTCKSVKAFEDFYKASRTVTGFQANCKECDREISRLRHAKNRTNRLEAGEKKRKDPEYQAWCKEYHAKRYVNNKAGIYARNRSWANRNKHKISVLAAKRRAAKLRAIPTWAASEYDKFIVAEIYHLARLRTSCTGVRWTVDHRVPLLSGIVCGLHCADNLQVLTASANSSKNNLWWEDMP